ESLPALRPGSQLRRHVHSPTPATRPKVRTLPRPDLTDSSPLQRHPNQPIQKHLPPPLPAQAITQLFPSGQTPSPDLLPRRRLRDLQPVHNQLPRLLLQRRPPAPRRRRLRRLPPRPRAPPPRRLRRLRGGPPLARLPRRRGRRALAQGPRGLRKLLPDGDQRGRQHSLPCCPPHRGPSQQRKGDPRGDAAPRVLRRGGEDRIGGAAGGQRHVGAGDGGSVLGTELAARCGP
ncbi:unnamed protein product, partial [Linum tenue]